MGISAEGAVFGRQSRNLFRTLEVKDYKGQCGQASAPVVLEPWGKVQAGEHVWVRTIV